MNAKKKDDMVYVLPKRRILMQPGKLQGNRNTAVYTTTLDHDIQSTTQDMAQALRAGKHLRRVMDNDSCSPNWRVQFYMSPYVRI
ncbi:Phosphoglycerate mutase-like protein AT74 [Glycine max]|nr:Phosphoglycerate mutase-like protein AT74 [Glycine max]